jgi:predicted helicase
MRKEYISGWSISEIMPVNSVGIVTGQDEKIIGYNRKETEELARLQKVDKSEIHRILYRPYDERFIIYDPQVVTRPRTEVMRHMMQRKNLALITVRQVAEGIFDHVMATRNIVESRITLSNKGIGYVFPLYLYPDPAKNGELFDNGAARHVNLNAGFIADIEKRLKLKFILDGKGNLKKTFGPEDVFNYIYAVFHSPTYRKRYAEFLKIDFPRVPLTSDVNLFRKLAALGGELVALHLLESPKLEKFITTYPEPGDNVIEKGYPKYDEKEQSVYINKTQRFRGIAQDVWEFRIGGYQVCEKWLKDRRGRNLAFNDLQHYQKVIVSLCETIRIMREIDEMVPSWPIE